MNKTEELELREIEEDLTGHRHMIYLKEAAFQELWELSKTDMKAREELLLRQEEYWKVPFWVRRKQQEKE